MMDKETLKQFKILKVIKPDEDFKQSTRNIILAQKPVENRGFSFLPKVIAFTAALSVILVGFIGFNSLSNPSLASLDQEELNNEIMQSLQIEEIEYRQNINETIASALSEVSSSRSNHLDPSILESENTFIQNKQINRDEEVGELLNQIIF
ncbi:MAG: hypothetical protein WDZ80_00815 [Candidatus Paceibacterota bacterium]